MVGSHVQNAISSEYDKFMQTERQVQQLYPHAQEVGLCDVTLYAYEVYAEEVGHKKSNLGAG